MKCMHAWIHEGGGGFKGAKASLLPQNYPLIVSIIIRMHAQVYITRGHVVEVTHACMQFEIKLMVDLVTKLSVFAM